MALSLVRRAARHRHPAIRMQGDPGRFPALAAGLQIHRDPNADACAGSPAGGLTGPLFRVIKTRAGPLQGAQIVA